VELQDWLKKPRLGGGLKSSLGKGPGMCTPGEKGTERAKKARGGGRAGVKVSGKRSHTMSYSSQVRKSSGVGAWQVVKVLQRQVLEIRNLVESEKKVPHSLMDDSRKGTRT